MQKPVQITKIENEKIAVAGSCFSHDLDAPMTESRIQLVLVYAKARRKTNQRRSEKTANENGNQNLGCEFWQCG